MKNKNVLQERQEGNVKRVRRKKFKSRMKWMKFSDLRVRI
jgi:hypothetical protein